MSSVSINTSSTANPTDMYGMMNSFAINPVVLGIVIIVIVIYALFFTTMGNGSISSTKSASFGMLSNSSYSSVDSDSNTSNIFLIIILVILALFIGVKVLQYFFSINVTADLQNLFTPNPQLDVTVDQTTADANATTDTDASGSIQEQRMRKQVFNIPENTYGYEDAKAVCQAYGARLATYKEVEESYSHGGEWCNYGWSDGQMALFPTQQRTFDNLQKIPGHEHDCGRPGVNGGYIGNPHAKFGVNCYGHKPLITQQEATIMENTPPYPITEKDIAFQQRVDYWKQRLGEVLVSPFNHQLWNQII